MHEIMLFLHFIGLALGIGVPIANLLIQRLAAAATPEGAAVLRSLPGRLAPLSWTGLGLLWLTGLWMLFFTFGVRLMPGWFWVKLLDVIALSGVVFLIWQTMQAVRAGDESARSRMAMLGPAALALGLLAVLLAVIAFN